MPVKELTQEQMAALHPAERILYEKQLRESAPAQQEHIQSQLEQNRIANIVARVQGRPAMFQSSQPSQPVEPSNQIQNLVQIANYDMEQYKQEIAAAKSDKQRQEIEETYRKKVLASVVYLLAQSAHTEVLNNPKLANLQQYQNLDWNPRKGIVDGGIVGKVLREADSAYRNMPRGAQPDFDAVERASVAIDRYKDDYGKLLEWFKSASDNERLALAQNAVNIPVPVGRPSNDDKWKNHTKLKRVLNDVLSSSNEQRDAAEQYLESVKRDAENAFRMAKKAASLFEQEIVALGNIAHYPFQAITSRIRRYNVAQWHQGKIEDGIWEFPNPATSGKSVL